MIFEVGNQVAIAGKSSSHLGCGSGLHLAYGLEGVFCIEVADAHLISGHDERNLMLSHHDGDVFHSCRSFSKPSACVVECQLRAYPSGAPFWCHEIPELVEVPEGVPESIASQGNLVFLVCVSHLFVRSHPIAVHIAP